MIIKTFDAFSRLSIIDINRVTNFLYQYSGIYKDTKNAIRKSILYAAKELPGLGGYVFIMEDEGEIIGAVVVNRTGMDDYFAENILVYLAVSQNFRKQGVALKLIEHTVAYCKGDIAIHINKNNTAIKFFEKQGFKPRNIEMRLKR